MAAMLGAITAAGAKSASPTGTIASAKSRQPRLKKPDANGACASFQNASVHKEMPKVSTKS